MYFKYVVSMALASTLIISACNSSTTSDSSDLSKPEAAHEFALNLKNAMVPIKSVEDVLTDFTTHIEQDISNVNPASASAIFEASYLLGSSLVDYIEPVYGDGRDVTSMDWNQLPANALSKSGISITRNGTTLTLSGADIDASKNDNTVDLSVTFTLPTILGTDSSINVPMSNLTIADNLNGSISVPSGSLTLNYPDTFDHSKNDDEENKEHRIIENILVFDDAVIILGDITLTGSANILYKDDTTSNVTLDLNDPSDYLADSTFKLTGSITNSLGETLKATTSIDLDVKASSYYNGNHSYSTMFVDALDLKLTLDLTDKTFDGSLLTAAINFELNPYGDLIVLDEYSDLINSEGNISLTFNGTIDLIVGEEKLGLGLAITSTEHDLSSSYIFDSSNKEQDVRFTMLADVKTDFNLNKVTVGNFTVDGEIQATVDLDNETKELIADFENLSDILLLDNRNVQLLEQSLKSR